MQQSCQERLAKKAHDGEKLEIWKKIFQRLTAADSNRGDKPEEMRWCDYFKDLVQLDDLDTPRAFLSSTLDREDAVIQVGVYVSSLKKALSTAPVFVERSQRQVLRRQMKIEKRENRLKAKVALHFQNPAEVEAQKEKRKHLG